MKKQSQLISFISVLALLGAFLLIIFVVTPRVRQLWDLSSQAKGKGEQIALKQQEVESVKEASVLVKGAKQEVEMLQIAVPDKEKAEEALAQLSSATAAAGLKMTSVGLHGAQDGFVKISMSVFGPFDKFIGLMGNLESNLRPIKIDDYTVTSSEDSSDVSASLNLLFPYLPQTSPTPQVSATASVNSATSNQENILDEE